MLRKLYNEHKSNKSNSERPAKLYGDLLFSKVTKGMSEKFNHLDDTSIQVGYNKVIDRTNVTIYYQVTSFREEINSQLISALRKAVRARYSGELKMDMVTRSTPYRVNWGSNEVTSNQQVWRIQSKRGKVRKDEENDEGFENKLTMGIHARNKRLRRSWTHYQEAEKSGTSACLFAMVIRVKIPKDELRGYTITEYDILSEFRKENLEIDIVQLFLHDFLNSSSPFKHETTKIAHTFWAERSLTTDITSVLQSIDQGKVTYGDVYLGSDILNHNPTNINLIPEGETATNMLIVGATSSGKSVLVKNYIEQLLTNNFFVYVNDFEGYEYDPIGEVYGAVFLDLRSGDGKYFEPLRLTNLTGNTLIDKDVLPSAISAVYAYMEVLMEKPLTISQKKIMSECIDELYKSFDVNLEDMETWCKSSNIKMHDLRPFVRQRSLSNTYQTRYGVGLVELADIMDLYFCSTGVNSGKFKNPISIDELKNERFIITRFGQDSKGDVASTDVDVKIKQLTKMTLETELGRIRRHRGEFWSTIYEELPRYSEHPGTDTLMKTLFTGIRKLNGSVVGIVNEPGMLVNDAGIYVTNTTFFVIGKSESAADLNKFMQNTPRLRNSIPLVEKLNNLQYCFYLNNSGHESIFKCRIPQFMLKGKVYKTRKTKNSLS